jgi:hypothetical protein
MTRRGRVVPPAIKPSGHRASGPWRPYAQVGIGAPRRRRLTDLLALVAMMVTSAASNLAAWDATGPQAEAMAFEQLWWLCFGLTCVLYAIVLGTHGIWMLRRHARSVVVRREPRPAWERSTQ